MRKFKKNITGKTAQLEMLTVGNVTGEDILQKNVSQQGALTISQRDKWRPKRRVI